VTLPARDEVTLQVTEIYLSVQGESTWTGLPCTFVRLTGCPLRCSYCDTAYAFSGGTRMALSDVLARVDELGSPLVEVTGGEPLAQPSCIPLLGALVDAGRTVLLETSGAFDIAPVPSTVHRIVDLKCPSSGEEHRNLYSNMDLLSPRDEVKFVIGTREDYEWSRGKATEHRLPGRVRAVLFSPVFGRLDAAELVRWIIADRLFGVRFQLQAHKHIWPPDKRAV
jgi:7-carboxy-7-deazaguanine synthase